MSMLTMKTVSYTHLDVYKRQEKVEGALHDVTYEDTQE